MTTLETLKEEDKILRGVKLPLYTTKEDEECILTMLCARELVYNWAIDKLWDNYNSYKDHMEDYKILSYENLTKMFTQYRKSDECDPLMKDLHRSPADYAIKDAVKTFILLRHGIPRGYIPRFHGKSSKRWKARSFAIRSERSYILDGVLHTENMGDEPRLTISVITHKYDGYGGIGLKNSKIGKCWYNVRIVVDEDGFYLTFSIPRDRNTSLEDKPWTEPIGIDVGCKTTFQLSTEEFFNQPDVSRLKEKVSLLNHDITRLYKLRKKKAHKQGLHVWDIPKSKNELTLIDRRIDTYKKIHNKIVYFYYQVVNDIVKRKPEAIVLETVYVRDLLRRIASPNVRREVVQVYFCMIRYMFESKCDEYSIPLYEVNPNYPSSLICNKCKYKHEDLGKDRIFVCPNCGYEVDRDLNASLNLRDVYVNKEVDNIKWWNGHGDKLILKGKTTHI